MLLLQGIIATAFVLGLLAGAVAGFAVAVASRTDGNDAD